MPYLNYIFILYSTIVKGLSKLYIPRPLRYPFLTLFGRTFLGMKEDDFKALIAPLGHYKNIASFFSREIDLDLRPMENQEFISPCDGVISEYGNISGQEHTLRVKGNDYLVSTLLKSKELAKKYRNGSYLILYLSPRNYHRFHVPMSGVIDHYEHLQGYAFPVNSLGLKLAGNVYEKNERVILNIKGNTIDICMAVVGACAVRGIKMLKFSGHKINKGEELGRFELGSSIVLFFSKRLFPDHEPMDTPVTARGSLFKKVL